MTRYSGGVALALRIARYEAWLGRAREVEPGHLLAGLSALCRADLGATRDSGLDPRRREAAEADAERLRACFAAAGIDPVTLRRRLRFALSVIDPGARRDMVPHRSPAARGLRPGRGAGRGERSGRRGRAAARRSGIWNARRPARPRTARSQRPAGRVLPGSPREAGRRRPAGGARDAAARRLRP
jgi:hypothetical protein